MNRESIIITLNNYEDLEKINNNTKYININITNIDNKVITYNIPIELENNCIN